ncbi:hypothetical protein [Escherichia coli]
MLPYISPLFPFLPANALKRHSLFGLHSKYECVYPRFYVSTSKSIIKALINMHSFEIQLSPIG